MMWYFSILLSYVVNPKENKNKNNINNNLAVLPSYNKYLFWCLLSNPNGIVLWWSSSTAGAIGQWISQIEEIRKSLGR